MEATGFSNTLARPVLTVSSPKNKGKKDQFTIQIDAIR
jgi:hypothetical protein